MERLAAVTLWAGETPVATTWAPLRERWRDRLARLLRGRPADAAKLVNREEIRFNNLPTCVATHVTVGYAGQRARVDLHAASADAP